VLRVVVFSVPMKAVLMLAAMPYPAPQGTQALVGELCRGLVARGRQLELLCYGHGVGPGGESFAVRRSAGLPWRRVIRSGPDPARPALDMLLARRAVQLARSGRFRLVHAHNYEGLAAGLVAARAGGLPLLYHAHNCMGDELPRYFAARALRPVARALGDLLDHHLPRRADGVICLHRSLAGYLQGCGVAPQRLAVVEPGIDVDFWLGVARPQEAGPVVVYCGNLDGYQRLPLLIAAVRRARTRVPGVELHLATWQAAQARRLVSGRGAGDFCRVVHCPDAAATRRALAGARLAASARTGWSGFPVKTLNHAAAGLPQVVFRSAAWGVEQESTGLVVEDDDEAGFVEALCRLLEDPGLAGLLGRQAAALARRRYRRERMVEQVERLWESLTGRQSRPGTA